MADNKAKEFAAAVDGLKATLTAQVSISRDFVGLTKALNEAIKDLNDEKKRKELERIRDEYLAKTKELSANTVATSGAAATVITTGTTGRR